MGPETTPSLISKGGIRYPPLGGRETDTPWEIGLSWDLILGPLFWDAEGTQLSPQ